MKKLHHHFCLLFLAAALSGCGGGTTSEPSPPSIQSSSLSYDKQATFYVGVTSLNPGTTFSASNCTTLQSTTSTVENYIAYTCKVLSASPVVLTGTDANGKVIAQQSFAVPKPQVAIVTSLGSFLVELEQVKAPISTANFLRYVQDGFYKDTLFHRVIPEVIQAGGFTTGPMPKIATYDPIVLESQNGLSNLRGTFAMARTPEPNSATSQFYINLKDNTAFDYINADNPGYAVFGSVISGISVIDKIGVVPTGSVPGLSNVPITEIKITNALRVQ